MKKSWHTKKTLPLLYSFLAICVIAGVLGKCIFNPEPPLKKTIQQSSLFLQIKIKEAKKIYELKEVKPHTDSQLQFESNCKINDSTEVSLTSY